MASSESTIQSEIQRNDQRIAKFRSSYSPLIRFALIIVKYCASAPRLLMRHEVVLYRKFQKPWVPRWPNLHGIPWHDPKLYGWAKTLYDKHDSILKECLSAEKQFTVSQFDTGTQNQGWSNFYLYMNGHPIKKNLAICPETAKVLRKIPINGLHVCFAALDPGGNLPIHSGPTNASLTAQFGLKNCAGCRIWIAGDEYNYVDGELIIFDDSYVHKVSYSGKRRRYSLMITFWHPSLNWIERVVIRTIILLSGKDTDIHRF